MPSSTYAQTEGNANGQKFFHDVEVSPETLADGSLQKRFNPKNYPKRLRRTIPDVTFTSILPATGAQNATLADVVIVGTRLDEGTTLVFSGTGITQSNKRVASDGKKITITLAIAADATLGTRTLTITNSDGGTVTTAAVFTVTA